jgi:hypothetical protein
MAAVFTMSETNPSITSRHHYDTQANGRKDHAEQATSRLVERFPDTTFNRKSFGLFFPINHFYRANPMSLGKVVKPMFLIGDVGQAVILLPLTVTQGSA